MTPDVKIADPFAAARGAGLHLVMTEAIWRDDPEYHEKRVFDAYRVIVFEIDEETGAASCEWIGEGSDASEEELVELAAEVYPDVRPKVPDDYPGAVAVGNHFAAPPLEPPLADQVRTIRLWREARDVERKRHEARLRDDPAYRREQSTKELEESIVALVNLAGLPLASTLALLDRVKGRVQSDEAERIRGRADVLADYREEAKADYQRTGGEDE